jgi:hypothetical protein
LTSVSIMVINVSPCGSISRHIVEDRCVVCSMRKHVKESKFQNLQGTQLRWVVLIDDSLDAL